MRYISGDGILAEKMEKGHGAIAPLAQWKEDLFREFVSEDLLNEAEGFEEFLSSVFSSGIESVMDRGFNKKAVQYIANSIWNEKLWYGDYKELGEIEDVGGFEIYNDRYNRYES